MTGGSAVVSIIIALGAAALFGSGCSHIHVAYHPDGTLASVKHTIIGTGQIGVLVEGTDVLLESEATGLSDNGLAASGMIAEGAVKGLKGGI